ncbi:unnamed protein product [Heligmosomoides polygyrus]|uniref:DOMON domain-containing protein n=1 Tax=Heligmosomoides polygyrus TaxID=6339 RepID=A0A3P7Y6Z8_HELPZ|nr:unnamed protein product [Heligmosomoides polygyrus]
MMSTIGIGVSVWILWTPGNQLVPPGCVFLLIFLPTCNRFINCVFERCDRYFGAVLFGEANLAVHLRHIQVISVRRVSFVRIYLKKNFASMRLVAFLPLLLQLSLIGEVSSDDDDENEMTPGKCETERVGIMEFVNTRSVHKRLEISAFFAFRGNCKLYISADIIPPEELKKQAAPECPFKNGRGILFVWDDKSLGLMLDDDEAYYFGVVAGKKDVTLPTLIADEVAQQDIRVLTSYINGTGAPFLGVLVGGAEIYSFGTSNGGEEMPHISPIYHDSASKQVAVDLLFSDAYGDVSKACKSDSQSDGCYYNYNTIVDLTDDSMNSKCIYDAALKAIPGLVLRKARSTSFTTGTSTTTETATRTEVTTEINDYNGAFDNNNNNNNNSFHNHYDGAFDDNNNFHNNYRNNNNRNNNDDGAFDNNDSFHNNYRN